MAGDDNSEFDPRFDPAFQRGFEGEVTRRAPQPTAYLPSNPVRQAPAAATVPGYATVQPGVVAQGGVTDALSPAAPGRALDDEPATVTAVVPETEAEYAAPGRNPFLIGLTVISVVLVLGGLAGLQWLRGRFLAPDIATELDFVTVQAATTGLVIVIGLGLATAIGVLFVHAARWGKRRA